MARVYAATLVSAFALFVLLLVAVRPVDSCVADAGSTGCECATGAACSAIWFSCRQDGTASVANIGLAFTYSQPQRSDPGYRWYIANGNGGPQYPGQTSGFVDGAGNGFTLPFLPYSTTSIPRGGPGSGPQWRTMGINGLSSSNAVTQGNWACTDNNLLLRSLNGGIGPAQPVCQYGTAPAIPVSTSATCNPCCPPSKLFDGFSQSTGWQLASIAVQTTSGSVAEYPSQTVRSGLIGLGQATVDKSNGLNTGELRQLVSITDSASGVQMVCYISTFNPCTSCPTTAPSGVTAPGCCASGSQLLNGACCPTSSIVTSPAPGTCCPVGGPWVVCPSGATGCTTAVQPTTSKCCLASQWIASTSQCCDGTTAPRTEYPVGSGQYVCCPTAQVVGGQCCYAAAGNTIVDGQCCASGNAVGSHCCKYCNTGSTLCSSVSPAPTTGTYTWLSNQLCCANNLLSTDSTTCCPSCVVSGGATPVIVTNDLRGSSDCAKGSLKCCPSNLKVNAVSGGATYCCPVGGDVGYFTAYTGTPYSSGSWAVTPTDENGQTRCCPDSNIKCDSAAHTQPDTGAIGAICCKDSSDVCTSSQQRCCPATEVVLYGTNQHGCCVNTKVSRGCNGSPTTAMTNCIFIIEGNCCPTGAVTTDSSNNKYCCFGRSGTSWVYAPACSACGTNSAQCCDANNAVSVSGAVVACCPTASSNYQTTDPLSGTGGSNYCCLKTQAVTAGAGAGAAAGHTYCCPAGGSTTWTVVTNGASLPATCCATTSVPLQPNTQTQILNVGCCNGAPPSGQSWWYINGACCASGSAVLDSGVWHCCSGFTSPVWVNGACCSSGRVLTFQSAPTYCCPNGGPNLPAGSTLCASFPPPSATPAQCFVYNGAPPGWIVKNPGGVTGNGNYPYCCPANYISYNNLAGAPAPSASTTYICCGTSSFTYTSNDACCSPSRVPTNWDGVSRSLPSGRTVFPVGTKYCCPSNVVTTTTYTQTAATQGTYNVDCCPVLQVNIDAHSGAAVTTSNSMCCNAANSFLVDQQATALNSNYKLCCPQGQVLPPTTGQSGTTYYCCENAVRSGDQWFTSTPASGPSYSGCCSGANIISNPGSTAERVCCPGTGFSWTDTAPNSNWPGGVDHCCDARFALPTTVSGLANSFCCPTNTPNAPATGIPGTPGNPTTPAWQVYHRIPSSSVTGSGWNNVAYQCCDPTFKQVNAITDGSGNAVNICCGGFNLTYIIGDNNHIPSCCDYDTIKWEGAQGDLTKASCCPASTPQTGTSQASGKPTCCTVAKYNGAGICCDVAGAPSNPVPTLNTPCCNSTNRLDVSSLPNRTAGDYICCPPIAGKPAPFVNPDPSYNPPGCCYGYATSQPPKACCSQSTDFSTSDNPCCDTVKRADGTCCPDPQWIPGAGGAPNTGQCCADTDVIVKNGSSTTCCAKQYADVTGTTCCLPSNGVVLDDSGNCCPTDVINTDPVTGERFCCGPSQRDDFGVCCTSAQTIHSGAVFNGVANATLRICCDANSTDCAGICYWNDPLSGNNVLVPFDTIDSNGVCCPTTGRDCAGLCADPNTGLPINTYNDTLGDCCPQSARDCLGVCNGRDRNCCENPATNADCGSCIAKTGCGWCSNPFSSAGTCLSGDHFGPYTDTSGLSPCDAGNRWVINPPSEVISQSGTFADGWNMQYKNYTVSLSPNDPLQVNFTVRVPANVPLDLYILQDGTASFGLQFNGQPSSLQNFQSVLPNLLSVISSNVTSDLLVGFGLFADKPVEPFGFWSADSLDYLWRNLAPLTATTATVVSAVNTLQNSDLQGGDDIPEGTLEALLAIGVRVSDVGWRQPTATFSSNHVVLVVTDAPPHKASLGQAFNPAGPFDLSYWNNPSAPDQYLGSNNYVRTAPAWVPNDLLGTFTPGQCGSRPNSASTNPPYTRDGICQDYPSTAQTIAALQPQAIAPVFVVAPTNGFQPNNVPYPTDIAKTEWTDFVNEYAVAENVPAGQFGLVTDLAGVGTSAGAALLEQAILDALYQITQTIALRVTSGSEWVTSVSPTEYQSAVPGQDYTFTVTLFWNGTWPGFDGPHPVDVLSLFPKTNFPIEPGHIDIYVAKTLYCGYCGDGIVQPEIGEQCEPGVLASADLPCCSAQCQFERTLCNGLARCSPSVCDATGHCADEPVTCTPIIDPVQSLCSTNSCINGQCVVSCFGANESNPCCDDGDNCTRDTCVSGVCRHDFELPCDCGGNPAYNSCFACIAVSNTSCGWDLATGTCVNVNITDLLLHPENYGINPDNVSVVVYEQDVADKRCVAARAPGSKVGIIVGVIAGVAALGALIALAAVFGGRIREIAQRIFGSTGASGGAANKVLDNPAYEVAIEGSSALYT